MDLEELKKYLKEEYEREFSGWDFSYLKNKMLESPLTWNYESIIKNYIINSKTMLDLGTGGGEFLDSLEILPKETFATEGYKPNVKIAQERLSKRNVIVKEVNEFDKLPFEDNYFDLIINRHEEYSLKEIKRLLKKDGVFITQQVGGLNDIDINYSLGAPSPDYFDWNLSKALEEILNNDLEIVLYDENIGYTRFYDIGSLVYYLKCIPWQINDFSIDKYISRLNVLNYIIKEKSFIDFINHRFILIVKK